MARFELGNSGGPGRPKSDATVRAAREIIKAKLTPALPGIIDRLLASRNPKLLLESVRVLLPYVAVRESAPVNLKFQQQEGIAERTLLAIVEERRRRAAAAAASPSTSKADTQERSSSGDTSESVSPID